MALVFPVNRHANTKVIEVPPTILHRALGVMAISLSRGADKMNTQSVIALFSITIRRSGLWSARTSLRSLHKPFLWFKVYRLEYRRFSFSIFFLSFIFIIHHFFIFSFSTSHTSGGGALHYLSFTLKEMQT